jgi:hypothetical protein
VRPACQRARWRCCTHRVRTTLSTLVAKDISRRRRGRVSQPGLPVKFVVGALSRRLDWTWTQVEDWAVCTYVCICGGCIGGSVGCWSVVTGARCPLTKPVVAAVELQATTEPHCSRGVQPGGICVYVGTARADSRRSGVGLAPRPQALPMTATALGSIFAFAPPPPPPPPPPPWVCYFDSTCMIQDLGICSLVEQATRSWHMRNQRCRSDHCICRRSLVVLLCKRRHTMVRSEFFF